MGIMCVVSAYTGEHTGQGSRETIYSLEHGRRDFIWPKTAKKLADALGVDPGDLYR